MCSLILSAFLIFHHYHQIQNFRTKPSRSLLLFNFSALVTRGNLNLRSLVLTRWLISSFFRFQGVRILCLYFFRKEMRFLFEYSFFILSCTFMLSAFVCCNDSQSQFWVVAPKWSSNVFVLIFLHWAKIVFLCGLWFYQKK